MFKTYRDLEDYVREKEIKMLDLKIPDLSGRWRHLTIPASRISKELFTEGFGFDGSNYGFTRIEASDMIFIPDLQTAFFDPFWEEPTLSFMGHIYEVSPDGVEKPYRNDPRTVLDRALNYMQEKDIADTFVVGPEFEYYILDRVSFATLPHQIGYEIDSRQASWNSNEVEDNQGYKINFKDGYHKDAPHDLHRNLRSAISLAIERVGIEVKYHHHEVGGPGQQEIEVKRDEASKMADAAMLIKYFVKNMAYTYGKTATFMPKPIYGEAGNGFHVHMQLSKNGNHLFHGTEDNYAGLSDLALYFMGGILRHTPALMGLAGPSTNSYKRLVKGYEAPVAICFATANRSAVIRIPGYATAPEDKRFEFRPGDATGNPYLVFAGLLMAGLDGIDKKIDPIKEGYGPLEKNVYEIDDKEHPLEFLPGDLDSALKALEEDHDFLLKDGIFTSSLIQSWIEEKKEESEDIKSYPHPREFALYYDI